RVGVVAVELGGDVDLDQVPRTQSAVPRDAVDGLVVDADAVGAGEVVDEHRRRAGPEAREDGRANGVELGGRQARSDAFFHLADGQSDDAPNAAESLEV